MRGFLALVKRELRSVVKEKTIMFAILVQFFIAAFSSVILVGIMAFYDPSSIGENTAVSIRAGIVQDDAGYAPEDMDALLTILDQSGVKLRTYTTLEQAEDAFSRGRLDTIIAMSKNQAGVVDMKLVMPQMDTQKTVVYMVLDEPLKKFENYLREAAGVELLYGNKAHAASTTYEFLYSIIVPILILFPALIAGSIVIDTISEEFENKTFDTLASAPVSHFQVVSAKVTAAVVTAAVQVMMWVGLLRLNDITVQNPVLVILLGIALALAVAVMTAALALSFKDRERTQFVYSIGLVALIGGSYFFNPSPFGLITRLSSGDPAIGFLNVGAYVLPVLVIAASVLLLSRRFVLSRR